MIQRKQTLFLLLLIITSVLLAVVNCNFLETNSGGHLGVSVSIITVPDIQPNIWHYVGTAVIFLSVVTGIAAIFLYKKRELQLKLSYLLMILQLILALIVSFCPVVDLTNITTYKNSVLAPMLGIAGMLGAYFAARYIKKDIELLKSADRIR